MVGEGVLHVSLSHPDVERVLIINRSPSEVSHPKLTEIIHKDFLDLTPIESQLKGYDACFFCLGVSSIGMKEPDYFRLTHTLTLHVASVLSRVNQGMVFEYISGASTDSSEKGKSMWARVKGKTENDLMKLPFKKAYAFRPGMMKAIPGLKRTLSFYKYIGWIYPIGKALAPGKFCTLEEVGRAMINVAAHGYSKNILEVLDILAASK